MKAEVIAYVADVTANGSYFSLSSVLLTKTSSHTCGRWYLPILVFVQFFQHINSLEDNIKFTAESFKADGSMPS